MTRDDAIALIRKTIIPHRGDHNYIDEPGVFEPHEWVIQSVLAAHAKACEEKGGVSAAQWRTVAIGMTPFLREYKPPLAHAEHAQALVQAVDAYVQEEDGKKGPNG